MPQVKTEGYQPTITREVPFCLPCLSCKYFALAFALLPDISYILELRGGKGAFLGPCCTGLGIVQPIIPDRELGTECCGYDRYSDIPVPVLVFTFKDLISGDLSHPVNVSTVGRDKMLSGMLRLMAGQRPGGGGDE